MGAVGDVARAWAKTRAVVTCVCVGERRGAPKINIEKGYLRENHGVVGDAHAGPGDRQVSLVAVEDVDSVCREHGIEATPGDFAANVATRGMDLMALPIGCRLRVGQATLEVTRRGKDPSLTHNFSFQGVTLLVHRGVFCRVLAGGWVNEGDTVEVVSQQS